MLQHYDDKYNWDGLEFPLAILKIVKFERNNPGIAINVLFNKKESIYTVRRSELNEKCSKHVNLLMIVYGEKRHYIATKNISWLFSKLNRKTQHAYNYCINCLNDFRTSSARDNHYKYCSSNGHAKVKMPSEKEKWLKFRNRQYQFKVPFMLYADFESILKPVDEWYREKINTMKVEKKGKTPYTENINKNVQSEWCVYSAFAYGDYPDLLKMYGGKDCVEKL